MHKQVDNFIGLRSRENEKTVETKIGSSGLYWVLREGLIEQTFKF